MRTRIYNPTTGKWLSTDPIGFRSGDSNLFRFVENNSINDLDPEGLARVELRWRTVANARDYVGNAPDIGGNHAFILVWETKCCFRNGKLVEGPTKVGTPRYFGGYKGSGFTWGTKLTVRYGLYVKPPKGKKYYQGAPDYYFQPGHPRYRSSIVIADDCLPASSYIERFKKIANQINALGRRYDWMNVNSNSVARTLIEVGLGLDITSRLGRNRAGLLGWRYIILPRLRNTTVEEALANPNMRNPLPGP